MRRTKLSIVIALAALTGCANTFDFDEETRNGDLSPGRDAQMQAVRGNTFVREIRTEDLAGQRPVFLTAQAKSLRAVLQETLPGYSIIPRGGVNLNDPIDVSAQGMSLNDFIEYIEGVRDLHIELKGNRVYISDFQTREWNLASFATSRTINSIVTSKQSKGAKAGDDTQTEEEQTTGSTIGVNLNEDEWVKILEGARRIIGAQDPNKASAKAGHAGAADSTSVGMGGMPPNAQKMADGSTIVGLNFGPGVEQLDGKLTAPDGRDPYIEGIRSVGIVTAGGKPSKLRILDRYLKKAIQEATKIVNVQVEAYDVVLNNDKQKGINWDVLKPGSLGGNLLNLGLSNTSQILTDGGGFWNITGSYEGDGGSAKTFIKFLENFGRVELQDQPNITVRNGVPAQIYAGEELTYIVDVEQSQDESGNTTVTPKLGRLKVGVTLAVTVRVLDDERLLVDVTPVISNLNGFDTIALGATSFETPRVALKEFSTQLITSSGQSVHLGGLITEKLQKAMERLPWQNVVTKAVLNPLTQNINNKLERRELVLVVTPTLVEGNN
ncbi:MULTISPECIES: type II secretion system protein GspD [Pseudomonas]|jgi:type II secretory pathway component GspD/PulD (secretin)|uniref:type II secretion system protein GspD n=1 Tax=Pseudomonas TaxID=286 RepID=UPI0018E77B2A|nr:MULTISPECIES: pilus assembly protein [Pseudomonas]MBJ2215863.1 pilus assembly protein [Pseudomonas carnis]MBP5948129.1 pilus assembly protein [Pseudomonas sp. P9(2020)]